MIIACGYCDKGPAFDDKVVRRVDLYWGHTRCYCLVVTAAHTYAIVGLGPVMLRVYRGTDGDERLDQMVDYAAAHLIATDDGGRCEKVVEDILTTIRSAHRQVVIDSR